MSNDREDNQEKDMKNNELKSIDDLSRYLKTQAGERSGRSIPPLEQWHPEQVADIDIVIKSNGEWWHEGTKVTRQSLVSLFATVLWKETNEEGSVEYYLKTPVQKLRIQVEDAPLFINDVGVVQEEGVEWLEFTTTTGDVVRLDDDHVITLREYKSDSESEPTSNETAVKPYMHARNGLEALIGRNTFYHLIELGQMTEQDGQAVLTLQSGGHDYPIRMPSQPI